MTRPIADLDVPLAVVEADMRLAEQAHQLDPYDTAFADLASTHPDACSGADSYPHWTPGRTK